MATVALLLPLLLLLLQAGASAATVTALNYSVTLAPFLYSPSASQHFLSGSVSARVSVLNDTRWLLLRRGSNLQLGDIWLQDGRRNVSVNSTEFVNATQEEVVTLNEVLQAGRQYVLVVPRFRAEVKWLQYSDSYDETRFAATCLGLSADQFLPYIGGLTAKVKVDVSIVRRFDFSAASNAESVGNRTEENVASWWPEVDARLIAAATWSTWRRDIFATIEMPITSLQFVVSQLHEMEEITDRRRRLHRFWSSSFGSQLATDFSRLFPSFIEYHEKRLGVEYPARKTDYFVLPQSDKIQNTQPVLSTFSVGLAALTWGIGSDDLLQFPMELMVGLTLTVPFSRQWLGTGRGDEQKWQLDGAAMLLASDLMNSRGRSFPELQYLVRRAFWEETDCVVNASASTDWRSCTRRMSSAGLFQQLRLAFGSEAFEAAVKRLAGRFAFNTVRPDSQLLQLLGEEARSSGSAMDFDEFVRRWTQQPGAPIVNCSVTGRLLTLGQQSTIRNSSATWPIPITVVTSENVTTSARFLNESASVQWLTQRQQSFTISNREAPPSWYVLNLRGAGMYRVNYNSENWAALSRQLRNNHQVLHPLERAALIDDSMELARLGLLNYSVPTDIVAYVSKENSAAVLDALKQQVDKFTERQQLKEQLCKQLRAMGSSGRAQREDTKQLWSQLAKSVDDNLGYCKW